MMHVAALKGAPSDSYSNLPVPIPAKHPVCPPHSMIQRAFPASFDWAHSGGHPHTEGAFTGTLGEGEGPSPELRC